MKKYILSFLSILSGITLLGGSFYAIKASAEGTITVDSSELSVVLPSSYEQYLPLQNPSSVAVSESFMAVADGSNIFVYDKKDGVYHAYSHTENSDVRLNIVTCMQFSPSDGLLYFTDTSTSMYILDCDTLTASATRLSCSIFTIGEDSMYYATVTAGSVSISMVNTSILSGGDSISANATQLNLISSTATPAMALCGNTLYYAIGNQLYSSQSETIVPLQANGNVQSLGFSNGLTNPYYTDAMGTFYANGTNGTVTTYEGSYSSLCSYQGNFYLVHEKSILLYDVPSGKFTDYEICSASSGNGRLNKATDLVLCDDKLAVADRGNRRVSVCDLKTGIATPLSTSVEPDLIAYTDDMLLVSNGSAAEIYTMDGKLVNSHSAFSGVILGVTGVYGKFYLTTSNNYHYCMYGKNVEDAYKTLDNTAKGLTSDVDGNLYVLYANGNVAKYSEAEYMAATGSGTTVCKFPTTVTKIITDFAGNLYGAYGNTLYYLKNGSLSAYEFLPDGAVFGSGYTACAYAISHTGSKLYALCGDFVVSTDTLRFDNLNDIAVGGSDKDIFDLTASGKTDVLRTDENTVFIRIDLSKLKNSAYFSVLSCTRQPNEKNVVKLGEIGNYNIVSVFDSTNRIYTANLVKKSYCTLIPEGNYTAEQTFPNGIAYTTNAVKLYKYPFISDSLVLEHESAMTTKSILLEKAEFVKVLQILDFGGMDYNFYCVEATIEGKTYTGYIPVGYLLPFDGTVPQAMEITYTYLTPDLNTVIFHEVGNDANILQVTNRTAVTVYGDRTSSSVTVTTEKDGVTYVAQISPSYLSGDQTSDLTSAIAIFIILIACTVIFLTIVFVRMSKRGD